MPRKDSQNSIKYFSRMSFVRVLFVICLIFVGCFRVIGIINTHAYENKTIENQLGSSDIRVKAHRGAIYDRNNQPIALSSTIYTVGISTRTLIDAMDTERELGYAPGKETPSQKTIRVLSELLEIPKEDITSLLNEPPAAWRFLKKNVSYEIGEQIRNENLLGVQLDAETKRNYPSPYTAPQVIGFIRGETLMGLESTYNAYLTGLDGRKFKTFEDDESVQYNNKEAIMGNSLITTLDCTIQAYADQICKDTFNDCRNTGHKAKYTAITVMNPKTGEIIAMSQYPTFSLNDPDDVLGFEDVELPRDEEEAEKIMGNNRNAAWRNFNVTDCFEPGSIFKPIVVAMALEENVITKDSTYYCGGSKNVAGTPINCHKLAGHGAETLTQVLDNSCNVGMMDIGLKLGKDLLCKYQHDFGIGELTEIDLPAESDFSFYVPEPENVGLVTLATESFGQGLCTSAIQMIAAFSSLINGGYVYKPYVVSQIVDADGKTIKKTEPEVLKKPISQDTSDFLRTAMQSVVESGTAKKAAIPGYAIGAKTGTAQQGNRKAGRYTLSTMAYFPVDDPQYIALAIIHEPESYTDGIVSPSPMIKELFQGIISYKSIPPSADIDASESTSEENELTMPDLSGMSTKEAINKLNALGMDNYNIIGNGDKVERQVPSADERVTANSSSILVFAKVEDKDVELSEVPDVTGLSEEDAAAALEASGFEVLVDEEDETEETEDIPKQSFAEEDESLNTSRSDDDESRVVYAQIPSPGISLEKGTVIRIKL